MAIFRGLRPSFPLKAFTVNSPSIRLVSCYRENSINLKGQNINYLKAGTGDKNIFLLPGILGTIWNDFKPQIEGIDKSKFTIYVWDPPGCGKSIPTNQTFDIDFYRRDARLAADFMKELGVDKYSLVGWSMGGITALVLAAQKQKSVEKIVVWGSVAVVRQEDMLLYKGTRDVSKWSEEMKAPMAAVYTELGVQTMWCRWMDNLEVLFSLGGDVCGSELAFIKSPTLVVHGDKDPLVPLWHAQYIQRNLPSAILHRFENGKHNVHLRYAKEFNELIQDFILNP